MVKPVVEQGTQVFQPLRNNCILRRVHLNHYKTSCWHGNWGTQRTEQQQRLKNSNTKHWFGFLVRRVLALHSFGNVNVFVWMFFALPLFLSALLCFMCLLMLVAIIYAGRRFCDLLCFNVRVCLVLWFRLIPCQYQSWLYDCTFWFHTTSSAWSAMLQNLNLGWVIYNK